MNGVYGLLIASLGIAGLADTAQAQNMEAMMKWTTAQVVRYDVVAEYKGQTSIASIPPNSPISRYDAQVVDRYEIDSNWNPQSMAMEGAPASAVVVRGHLLDRQPAWPAGSVVPSRHVDHRPEVRGQ